MVVSALYNNGLSGLRGNVFYHTNTTSTSSSSSKKYNSVEELEEARRKYNEKILTQQADAIRVEKEKEIALKEVKETREQIENSKQEDGSSKIQTPMEEYKKLPWWKKALRTVSNMGQGILNLGCKFIGLEDGKWNWKSCLKNLAIAGAAVAACAIPGVGPFISAGLIASGVASGGYAVYKGIKNTSNAKTLDELDAAHQQIGSGLFIGVSSALGIRGLGKGFRINNPQPNAISQTAPSIAKTRSSLLGKNWQKIDQFSRDITVNAWKATKDASMQQRLFQGLAKTRILREKGFSQNSQAPHWTRFKADVKSFGQTYKNNFVELFPIAGKRKFEQTKQNTTGNIQKRIDEIGPNPTDKLLQAEQKLLQQQLKEIQTTTTKNSWNNISKNSKIHQQMNKYKKLAEELQDKGTVKINGRNLNKNNAQDVADLNQLIKQTELIAKQLEALANVRRSTMRTVALRPKKNQAELNAYLGETHSTSFGYIRDINKGTYSWKTPIKLGWEAMCLPFKPWQYLSTTPAGSIYKIKECVDPVGESNMFVDLFGMCKLDLGMSQYLDSNQTQEMLASLNEQEKAIKSGQYVNNNGGNINLTT